MSDEPRPAPHELWEQAQGDPVKYRELMARAGHLVPVDPDDPQPKNLPCGWPGNIDEATADAERERHNAETQRWMKNHPHRNHH